MSPAQSPTGSRTAVGVDPASNAAPLGGQPVASGPDRGSRRREFVVLGAIAVVAIVAVAGGLYVGYLYQSGGPQNPWKMNVSEIQWMDSSSGVYTTSTGFNATYYGSGTVQQTISASIPCQVVAPGASCRFFSPIGPTWTNGPDLPSGPGGFTFIESNTPANVSGGQSYTVTYTFGFHQLSYAGPLSVEVTVCMGNPPMC